MVTGRRSRPDRIGSNDPWPSTEICRARPYADSAAAARKLLEIATSLPICKGGVCIGKWINAFLAAGGSVAEYGTGREQGVLNGLFSMHECVGFVMLPAGTIQVDEA
jgi:hypothetical protein